MFKYKFLQLKKIKNKNFYFDFVQIHDIQKIRVLRNSNIQILRQKKNISIKKQNNYFFSQVKKSTITPKPNMILFSIYSNLKFIGYGGFVNIDWPKKIAELSFLTNIDVSNIKKNHEKIFSLYLSLAKRIAKDELKFKKLYSETYSFRKNHIKILEQSNFKKIKKKLNKKNLTSLIHTYDL